MSKIVKCPACYLTQENEECDLMVINEIKGNERIVCCCEVVHRSKA